MHVFPGGDAPRPEGALTNLPRMSRPAPLIGRDRELASLTPALVSALAGAGGVIVIRGEAGVGKTRLAEALLHSEPVSGPNDALVLRGKATERETPLVYEAFITALRQLRRLRGLLSLEACPPRLEPYRPALAALLPEWRAGLDLPAVAGDRYFLFEGVAELFSELVDVQPLCLFLDDAQWMDESSGELVAYLARSLSERPFAFLLGIRDGESPPHLESLLADLRRIGPFASLTLRRLDTARTASLAAAWLGVDPASLDPALSARLFAETQGNPFFLQELLATLVETDALCRNGDRIRLASADSTVLPSGVLAFVQRRIGFVAPEARVVLEAASVIGELVEVELLRRVLDRPLAALLIALDALERRLFLAPDDRAPERSVRFAHPQIRQAVYLGLSLEARFGWHRQLAAVLEGLPEGHPARSVQAIAYHLSLAEEGERAIPYLLAAGEKAMQVPAFAEAGWHYARAARHLEQLKLQGCAAPLVQWEGELLLMLGHQHWAQRRAAESQQAFLKAWQFLRDVEGPECRQHRTQAALFCGSTLIGIGDAAGARRQLEACRPWIEAAPVEWGLSLYYRQAWRHLLEAEGKWEEAEEALRRGLAEAIEQRHVPMMLELALHLHERAVARGEFAEAHPLERIVREAALEARRPHLLCHLAQAEQTTARARGDWATARSKAEEILHLAGPIDHRWFLADARYRLLSLQLRSDPTAAWLPLCQEAEEAEAAGDLARAEQFGLLKAICAMQMGHLDEAAREAEAVLARADRVPAPTARAALLEAVLGALAEIALRREQPEEASQWLSAGDPARSRPGEFWAPLRHRSLSARLAAAEGRIEEARAGIAAVAAELPRLGEAWLRGMILGDLAIAHHLLGDVGEAARRLADAETLLARCGAAPAIAALRSALGLEPGGARDAPAAAAVSGAEVRVPGDASRETRHPEPGTASEASLSPGLRVRMLGGFEVWRGSERVAQEAWGSRKARNLFKVLALQRGRPVLIDELLELFWPDLPPESAGHALRTTLHRIRRVLEPKRKPRTPSTYLRVAEDAVHFPAEGRIWLDAAEFEARLREAERRDVRGEEAAALQGLREALDIYSGELLPEDRYEEWSLAPREQLQEQCRGALTRLWRAADAAGAHTEALRLGERMLALDPCADEGVRWVLRALDALNRRTEAVRRYDQFARRLDRELGMEPEAETRRLVEAIQSRR